MLPLIGLLLAGCDTNESDSTSLACETDVVSLAREGGIFVDPNSTIVFHDGPQGGFHTDLGAWLSMGDPNVALSVDVYDENGERIASNGEGPLYYALADYDGEDCVGWATTRTFLGGQPEMVADVACTFDGAAATVAITAQEVLDESESLFIEVPVMIDVSGC